MIYSPHHALPMGRYWIWIDGVGGYLACEESSVVLGRAVPGSGVAVPLLADMARRHAAVHREEDMYWLEAYEPTRLNGARVNERATLRGGDELELGQGVRLRFTQPHPLSATARLDFASRHRTQPKVDGVLLLADTCLLGPSATCHVQCRDWTRELILYRQASAWFCRLDGRAGGGALQVDGRPHLGPAPLDSRSRIVWEQGALQIERCE